MARRNKYTILILTLISSLFFIGCKDTERINQLTTEKDNILNYISSIKYDIRRNELIIDSLTSEKSKLEDRMNILYKKADEEIRNSPMASAYIKRYDQSPVQILLDYASRNSDDERDILLFMDAILLGYSVFNEDVIESVRSNLNYYDSEVNQTKSIIYNLENLIYTHKNEITRQGQQIVQMNDQRIKIESEIMELNN